ncbi:hypothetical protein BJV82DRAFT_596486 [Fennellomyces sp. T-0311]|nr:hypothetical protein BJV82DRAFT_596486 [Fennellomyces sp. T-0311]
MDVALLCRSSSDDVRPLAAPPDGTSESEDDQNHNTKRNDIGLLPPLREACAGTIGFQQQPLANESTDFVVLPPLTPTPLSTNNSAKITDDTSCFSEAVATCAILCQEIEQLRRGWSTWSVQDREAGLDQLSKSATSLLHTLRQEVSSSSPMDEDEPPKATSSTTITTQSSASASSSTTASIPPITDPLSTSPEYVMIRRARNLQDAVGMRQSYRRRAKKTTAGQRCHSCHTTETPEWRRGPDGARTLCNACGLHYSKLLRRGSLTVQRGYAIGPNEADSGRPSVSPRIIEYPARDAESQLPPPRVGVGIGGHSSSDTSFINYVSQPTCNESRPRDHPP